jgi:hypothetical protein
VSVLFASVAEDGAVRDGSGAMELRHPNIDDDDARRG